MLEIEEVLAVLGYFPCFIFPVAFHRGCEFLIIWIFCVHTHIWRVLGGLICLKVSSVCLFNVYFSFAKIIGLYVTEIGDAGPVLGTTTKIPLNTFEVKCLPLWTVHKLTFSDICHSEGSTVACCRPFQQMSECRARCVSTVFFKFNLLISSGECAPNNNTERPAPCKAEEIKLKWNSSWGEKCHFTNTFLTK